MAEGRTFDDVAFLLDTFARHTPGVSDAVVVSSDGLLMAKTAGMDRAAAERFAAAASGLISLAHAADGALDGGAVREIIVELESGFVFVTGISHGSSLAVTAESTCDVGRVGYEMGAMVARCAEALTPRFRAPDPTAAP